MNINLWDVIKESKAGHDYLFSEKQYDNLYEILSKLPKEQVKALRKEWSDKIDKMFANPEFDKLHMDFGGMIDGGDDTFYMDFGNWIIAQGEELYDKFMTIGHQTIYDYIEKHCIPVKEYTFECMAYAFHDFVE